MNKNFTTKKDYEEALGNLIEPLIKYYSEGKSKLNIGYTATNYSDSAIGLEGFSRILWGLIPFLSGGSTNEEVKTLYIEGFKNGTNPNHIEYWGTGGNDDQRYVEMAVMGLGLLLIPDFMWGALSESEKKNLNTWLLQINSLKYTYPQNNWLFFRVLVNIGLRNVGGEYSEDAINTSLDIIDSCYLGDGWYSDGKTKQLDYYIPFAMHFYSLIYAKTMKDIDPIRCKKYIERAKIFAEEFIYWFSEDGDSLPYGRSLGYRFAQCCFWGALAFADVEVFSWGIIKGIINRHFRNWFNRPTLDCENKLTLGYAYPNLNMCEGYNSPGSPYWALKSFIILALPEGHPFWLAKEEPLPELSEIKIQKHPMMIIDRREKGNIVALTSGQYATWTPVHNAERYSKFAYSSYFGFNVPRSYFGLNQAAPDNMLAFLRDGLYFVRRQCDEVIVNGKNIYSKWSPMDGVIVETVLEICENGHIRRHTINTEFDCSAVECGFSLPINDVRDVIDNSKEKISEVEYKNGNSKIELLKGKGTPKYILCEANTNILHNRTVLPYIELKLSKGITLIEVFVAAKKI